MHNEQTSKGGGRIWEMLWNLTYGIQKRTRTNKLTLNYFLSLALNSYLRCLKYFFTLLQMLK